MNKRYTNKSHTKKQQHKIEWNKIDEDVVKPLVLNPPTRTEDAACNEVWNNWVSNQENSGWINPVASVQSNNSLTQHNSFVAERMAYQECSFLATDSLIHNAISKHTNECFRKGYKIILPKDTDKSDEIMEYLENRVKDLRLDEIVREGMKTSLVYGSSLLYIAIDSKELNEPFSAHPDVMQSNKIRHLKVIPPYLAAAQSVNAFNPLEDDYMTPRVWYINGGTAIHKDRLYNLIIFDVPAQIKPIYNYGGISLTQFMKKSVGRYNVSLDSLADLALRFKTMVIKSDMSVLNEEELRKRSKYIVRTINNNGVIYMTSNEDLVQTITPLTGLDRVNNQLTESVAVNALLSVNGFFGTTPSGLNSTGAFELKTQYNTTQNIQNNKLKPFMEKILCLLCAEMGIEMKPEIEFNELDTTAQLEQAQAEGVWIDNASKLILGEMNTPEQGAEYLKQKEILKNNFKFEDSIQYEDDDEEPRLEEIDYV